MADRITVSGDAVITEDESTGDVTAHVDALTDASDGGAWETLKLLGFSEGDFVPLVSYSTRSDVEVTKSGDTYTSATAVNEFYVNPSDYPGSGLTYRLTYKLDPNGDQIDIRMFNSTDTERLLQTQTTVDSGGDQLVVVGPHTYEPPTTDAPIEIHPQWRNGDNTTTVTLEAAQMEVGCIL